jgi:hypothetical protein
VFREQLVHVTCGTLNWSTLRVALALALASFTACSGNKVLRFFHGPTDCLFQEQVTIPQIKGAVSECSAPLYIIPTLLYPTLPYSTLSCSALPCPSYPALPYPALPCLPYPTLPYPTLPYPVLPYPTLPYPTLPYPALLTRKGPHNPARLMKSPVYRHIL